MSNYDDYDDRPRRHRSRRHHDSDRGEPQYVETRETYVARAPDPPYVSSRTDLVRQPRREDSDLSIEEVRREFPPPGGAYVSSRSMVPRDDRYGSGQRSRSADRGSQYDDRDYDRHSRNGKTLAVAHSDSPRRRSLSRNQKIIAAVGGAAIAVGGKELWDRRSNHGEAPEQRNLLATAALGAAGAFAGYEGADFAAKRFGPKDKVREKAYVAVEDKDGNVAEYYSSGEETAKPKKSRRKSIVEGALGLAGIAGLTKAATSGKDDKDGHRDGHRDRRGSGESRRSRSRGPSGANNDMAKYQQAAKAALLAGAAEAFRVRNEPGGWGGAKGKRILTAAIGAGGINGAVDKNPDKSSKRHILESVIGGLAGNRLINGSRNDLEVDRDGKSVRGGGSRSRSRSRAPGSSSGGGGGSSGLAALATAGLGALAGKKLLDRSRSRERDGDDRRRRDYSSEDEDRGSRHKRSKSVTDYARSGLAALGIGGAAEAARDRDDRHDGRREVVEETTVRKSRRRRSPDDDYDRHGGLSSRGVPYGDSRHSDSRSNVGGSRREREGQRARRVAEGRQSASDSDSVGSSSGDEKKIRKAKGKQFLTAGLATVATIHAAHNVYQSMEKRNARHKAVKEGAMTPEEARKLKAKARLQDAASIGIAALGIKGAYSEWKEMKEVRDECHELAEKKEKHHQKRIEIAKNGGEKPRREGDSVARNRLRRADSASAPDLTYGGRYPRGPQYLDDNPYSAVQVPAVGYGGDGYR